MYVCMYTHLYIYIYIYIEAVLNASYESPPQAMKERSAKKEASTRGVRICRLWGTVGLSAAGA